MNQTDKFCPRCKKHTLHGRNATNHVLHLLLTFVTFGFWFPVWILASIKIGGWRCQTCGYAGNHLVRLGVAVVCVVLFVTTGLIFFSRNQSSPKHNAQQTPQPIFQSHPQSQPRLHSEPKHYQKIRMQGKIHFVWIDPQHKYEPNVYEQAIAEIGGNEQFCFIFFWDNRNAIPTSMPMNDEQVKSQVANYERNRTTGHERFFYLRNGDMVEPFGNRPLKTPIPTQTVSTKPANKPEKKVYSESETVHVGYTSYSVWCSWWSNRLSDNQFLNQRPNGMFLFVELTVRNNDKKPRMIPPFTLIDDSGAEYEASSHGWAVEGSIGLIDSLNPSVSKQGFVVFDVPQGRNYRLKLSGGYWSLEDAYVQLAPKASREDAKRAEQDRQDEEARAEKQRQTEAKRQAEKERQEAVEAAKWRTWTDSTGTHKTEAKFGGVTFGKVKLIKRDGSTVQVPLEKLSDEDRKWIANRQK